MAADMAVELRKQNVACVSLWPGDVKTEIVTDLILSKADQGGKVLFNYKCYVLREVRAGAGAVAILNECQKYCISFRAVIGLEVESHPLYQSNATRSPTFSRASCGPYLWCIVIGYLL